MRTTPRWLITITACVLIFAALAGFKFFQIKAAIAYGKSFPEPSESVEAVVAAASTFNQSVSAIGVIVAPQALALRNEVEGQISELNFSSGDVVKKGEVLVQLDIDEELARLKAAQARVDLAKLDLDRVSRLIKQKTVSEESVDQARANHAIAQADVLALQAIIAKKTLRAPFDAIVGIHSFNVGEQLQSNTTIVNLVGINDYTWVDFNLPLAQANIDVGSVVTVIIGRATGPSAPSLFVKEIAATEIAANAATKIPAKIIAKDPIASASSRNLRLRARIETGLTIPPNSVVRVNVPVASSEQIQIPTNALLKDGMGDYVYVLAKNKSDAAGGKAAEGYRAQRRAIVLGDKNDLTASVISGLNAGDLIATQGAFKLRENLLTYVRQRNVGSKTE